MLQQVTSGGQVPSGVEVGDRMQAGEQGIGHSENRQDKPQAVTHR